MGGRRADRRAAAAAAAAAAEDALRRGCEEVLRLKMDGDSARAGDRALKLVGEHPKSAVPCNLLGFVMEAAAAKVQDQLDRFAAQDPGRVRFGNADADPDAASIAEDRARAEERATAISHLAAYQEGCAAWYGKAATLAPRCPFTRASYARMLGISNQTAEAYREFSYALQIRNPESPEKNNPWLDSTDLDTDEERKASAIDMTRKEFDCFLHLADTRVYTACRDLLYNIRHGTPGTKAKNEATDLSLRYPFSARASLLVPFLMRSSIDTSASSIPKLKQYQQLLRVIADCVDMFPSSTVISLFRAQVLFAMEHYLETSIECLRGLRITKPDDPVSQDIPPGYAKGYGRAARVESINSKLIDLLEQSEEKVVDAEEIEKLLQALSHTHGGDAAEPLVKVLVQGLGERLMAYHSIKSKSADVIEHKGALSKEQSKQVQIKMPKGLSTNDDLKGSSCNDQQEVQVLEEDPKLNVDANKGDGNKGKSVIEIQQSVLYSNKNKKFPKKTIEEAVRPLQIMGNRTVPKETVDKYAEYCYLRSLISVKKEICHQCVFEAQNYYNNLFPKTDMIVHCTNKHSKKGSTFRCDVKPCAARLRTDEEMELHRHYCHVLESDWWKQWW